MKVLLHAIVLAIVLTATGPQGQFSPSQAAAPLPFKDPEAIVYPEIDFDPPSVERFELPRGMVLYYLEDRELPLVTASFVLRAGSVYDPPGREGLADLAGAAMRTGGTASLDPDVFDDELDYRAADLSVSVGPESFQVSLSVHRDSHARALELLADMLMNPAFAEDRFERARALQREELLRIPDNPQRLAFREFRSLLYRNSDWGRQSSLRSLADITVDDCRDFHSRYFSGANTRVAVTGDLSAEEAIELITTLFASWEEGVPPSRPDPPVPAAGNILYVLPRDTPQSVVLAGHIGPGKACPEYYAMNVLDFIIGGGGFRSRLFMDIRTSRGLAYSTGSRYNARSGFGVFTAYAVTGTESTTAVLEAMTSIIEDAVVTAVDEEVLHWARHSLTNSFLFSFTSAHQIARQALLNEFDGLPDDFLRTYPEGIQSVTAKDVRQAAERYLDGGRRTMFTLGTIDQFREELASFGDIQPISSDLLTHPENGSPSP